MANVSDDEKKVTGHDVKLVGAHDGHPPDYIDAETWDPAQEPLLTRLGLSVDSFRRAPGTLKGIEASGDIPPEFVQKENPLLQHKMKPRHLQVSVGLEKFMIV